MAALIPNTDDMEAKPTAIVAENQVLPMAQADERLAHKVTPKTQEENTSPSVTDAAKAKYYTEEEVAQMYRQWEEDERVCAEELFKFTDELGLSRDNMALSAYIYYSAVRGGWERHNSRATLIASCIYLQTFIDGLGKACHRPLKDVANVTAVSEEDIDGVTKDMKRFLEHDPEWWKRYTDRKTDEQRTAYDLAIVKHLETNEAMEIIRWAAYDLKVSKEDKALTKLLYTTCLHEKPALRQEYSMETMAAVCILLGMHDRQRDKTIPELVEEVAFVAPAAQKTMEEWVKRDRKWNAGSLEMAFFFIGIATNGTIDELKKVSNAVEAQRWGRSPIGRLVLGINCLFRGICGWMG